MILLARVTSDFADYICFYSDTVVEARHNKVLIVQCFVCIYIDNFTVQQNYVLLYKTTGLTRDMSYC